MVNDKELATFIEDIKKHTTQVNTVQRELSRVVSEYNGMIDALRKSLKSGNPLEAAQLEEIISITEKSDNATQLLNTSSDVVFLKIKNLEKKL